MMTVPRGAPANALVDVGYRPVGVAVFAALLLTTPLYGGLPVGPFQLTEIAVVSASLFGIAYVSVSTVLSTTQGFVSRRLVDCVAAILLLFLPVALSAYFSDAPLPTDIRATRGFEEAILFVSVFAFSRFVPWEDRRSIAYVRLAFRAAALGFLAHFLVAGANFGFIGFANHKNVIGGACLAYGILVSLDAASKRSTIVIDLTIGFALSFLVGSRTASIGLLVMLAIVATGAGSGKYGDLVKRSLCVIAIGLSLIHI